MFQYHLHITVNLGDPPVTWSLTSHYLPFSQYCQYLQYLSVFLVFLNICNICSISQYFQYFLSNCTISHCLLLAFHVLSFTTIFCDLFTIYQFIYLYHLYLWLCLWLYLWLYTSYTAFSIPLVFVPSMTISFCGFPFFCGTWTFATTICYTLTSIICGSIILHLSRPYTLCLYQLTDLHYLVLYLYSQIQRLHYTLLNIYHYLPFVMLHYSSILLVATFLNSVHYFQYSLHRIHLLHLALYHLFIYFRLPHFHHIVQGFHTLYRQCWTIYLLWFKMAFIYYFLYLYLSTISLAWVFLRLLSLFHL